jgi:SAM-dependent MidA family methyltransferase
LLPAHLKNLPPPAPEAAAHSAELAGAIAAEIAAAGGWLGFARFMELALHAPGLGYYSAGAAKFGAGGDFVTAPGLGRLFGRTLARQAAQVLQKVPDVLELGAGTGLLACDLLNELAALKQLPRRYLILETSADLRERQRALFAREVPAFIPRIEWLDRLPPQLDALIIANEVLDAMPVHVIESTEHGIAERGVVFTNGRFQWEPRPARGAVLAAAQSLNLPPGYATEVNLAVPAFIATLGAALNSGVGLFIDYGFPAREYYHPQRSTGTLMCHYRHHAHDDPLGLVGLQDITAHVDFSAIADAATAAGLDVLGYANQAQFLINCGITDVLGEIPPDQPALYLPRVAEAQKLMSPAEMGELFKVIAVGRNFGPPLMGFASGDKRGQL